MAQGSRQLQPGTLVGDRWHIIKKLGEGAFGPVYKVHDAAGNAFVLKVESMTETVQLLKLEWHVLTKGKEIGARHLVNIEDANRFNAFNYLVVTMVGQCLNDLRKLRQPEQKLTIGCAISVGRQCLEAVEDMHKMDYLHRDIRLSQFTIGRQELGEQRKVYLMDFGHCRMISRLPPQQQRIRVRGCGFRPSGTRYAPLSRHDAMEESQKDDVEQWLYMLVLLSKGALPWPSCDNNYNDHVFREIGEQKRRCHSDDRAAVDQLFAGCPRPFIALMRTIDACQYRQTPDYARLYALLSEAIVDENAHEFPYDWEERP